MQAQGISRSNGIGFRFGLWKTARSSSLIKVTSSRVEVSGAGSWLYFFSRLNTEWFYEFHLGAFGSVITNETTSGGITFAEDDVTLIIPFLFGMRYDFMAGRTQSGFQPYLAFGAGPYWITNVESAFNPQAELVDSGLQPGAFLGGGLNIALASWFALNFDMKYHFVDFQVNKELSGVEFGMGFSFMWGQKSEIIRIKEVKMVVNDIYPAYYQFYNLYPLAIVSVENRTKRPIEVNIRSIVKLFSDRPSDSGFIRIGAKETKDIPVTAIFSPRIRRVAHRESTVLDLSIEARAGSKVTEHYSSPIMIHSPNSWSGEMNKLVFFVTADDDEILNLSRRLVGEVDLEAEPGLRDFHIAEFIFEQLSEMDLRYHSDPNVPFYQDDRVQYAHQTLDLRTGDCDDLVVLYASLLESAGINTAFVEVRDPKKELAHLYLMFNTRLPPDQGYLISSNEKRYLLRKNSLGQETIWIPVETTVVGLGFEEAWKAGALQYLQEADLRRGLTKGWVKIIDVE
ncbi:hypothetical protein MJD09_26900 [bacterium]|nr:hypothetical protein [bacterium]